MQKVGQMAETIKTFQVAQIGEYIIKHVIVEISKRSVILLLSRASQNSHILVSDPQILLRKTPMTGQAGGIPGVKATSQKVFLRAKNRRKKLLRKSSKMTIKIIN